MYCNSVIVFPPLNVSLPPFFRDMLTCVYDHLLYPPYYLKQGSTEIALVEVGLTNAPRLAPFHEFILVARHCTISYALVHDM